MAKLFTRAELRTELAREAKATRERLLAQNKRARIRYNLYLKLIQAGYNLDLNGYQIRSGEFGTMPLSQIAGLKKFVGSLRHAYTDVYDEEKNLVKIDLAPVDDKYRGVRFSYVKQLTERDKCKIVKNYVETTSVVCPTK